MLILALCLAVLAIWGIALYNRLVRLKLLMREAHSGIDVQLKRRHDLVPSVVECVKGYARHEQSVLEQVTRLRAGLREAVGPQQAAALENELSLGLRKVFALAEQYPDLKANRSFLELHRTLVEIEDELQLARRYFNGTVRNHNIAVESFPANLLAGMLGYHPAPFFEIAYATERRTPDVRF